MIILRYLLLLLVLPLTLAACDSSQSTQSPGVQSSEGFPVDPSSNPTDSQGVTLQGGDQGREGGHFLICDIQAPVPSSRMPFEKEIRNEKIFFIDYFLEIQSQQARDELRDFNINENDVNRLDQITKRLLFLFRGNPEMKAKALRMDEYSSSFMERKGRAQWIENTDLPYHHEVTEDFTPEDLSTENQYLVEEHCQARFFQAAIYDYSQPGREIFYYSEFFENQASLMQKSFRNAHELLRYILHDETPQVIKLTTYFHSKDFFVSSETEVRQTIAAISANSHSNVAFYE